MSEEVSIDRERLLVGVVADKYDAARRLACSRPMKIEWALSINPSAVNASDELVFTIAVSASIPAGPVPFKVTYPVHNHVSGKIRQVMRRAVRNPAGGRVASAAPARMVASTAAPTRA